MALVLARILLGCFFVVSGLEKLISPHQNFLYVVQSYQLLPGLLEESASMAMPWVEFILGVFLILGLWLKIALRSTLTLTTIFIVVVGQALIRHLPINECGCFGELISVPLSAVIIIDSGLWLLIAILTVFIERASPLSLDRYFLRHK